MYMYNMKAYMDSTRVHIHVHVVWSYSSYISVVKCCINLIKYKKWSSLETKMIKDVMYMYMYIVQLTYKEGTYMYVFVNMYW